MEPGTHKTDSRQNSDGSHRPRDTRNSVISQAEQYDDNPSGIGIHVSRPSSVVSHASIREDSLLFQTIVPPATSHAAPHTRSNDPLASWPGSTCTHPLSYGQPSPPATVVIPELPVSQPERTMNPNYPPHPSRQSTRSFGPPPSHPVTCAGCGGKRMYAGTSGVCAYHSNYSSDTIYPNIVSAAGLSYGSPFGPPTTFASPPMMPQYLFSSPPAMPQYLLPPSPMMPQYPLFYPGMSVPAMQFPQSDNPSRRSTGGFPLATALDGMQSPAPAVTNGLGNADAQADVERFAPVQQNTDAWKPTWDVFPLKVYRGHELKVLEIQRGWDDEVLLRELGIAYDGLRQWYRKYFSIMNIWWVCSLFLVPCANFLLCARYVTMVAVCDTLALIACQLSSHLFPA